MEQMHRRFTGDQARALLKGCCQGLMAREEVQEALGIGRSRFFALLKEYKQNPQGFSVAYRRSAAARIPEAWEGEIARELLMQRALVEDPELPLSSYNYSFAQDRQEEQGIRVSLPTIISRAKNPGRHLPQRKKKALHGREVITAAIGALVQHHASHHLWSPTLPRARVTSLDDFSRKPLFADFFRYETAWTHIQAAEAVIR